MFRDDSSRRMLGVSEIKNRNNWYRDRDARVSVRAHARQASINVASNVISQCVSFEQRNTDNCVRFQPDSSLDTFLPTTSLGFNRDSIRVTKETYFIDS